MHEELRLDNQICFRLYTAARLITQAYTPMLTELGITYPQYLVLMVLWEQDQYRNKRRTLGCALRTGQDLPVWRSDHSGR